MKFVINAEYGEGFVFSDRALEYLGIRDVEKARKKYMNKRTDPKLIACVDKFGPSLAGDHYVGSYPEVVNYPDDALAVYLQSDQGMETLIVDLTKMPIEPSDEHVIYRVRII